MKVHITLVGGQPAPVYHGIVATKPDKVVYVYSKESLTSLMALRNEVRILEDEYPELDATDAIAILNRAEEMAEKYKDEEVTVNISSGTKPWTYLFGKVFDRRPNAMVFYMDQNNVLWNYSTMQTQKDFPFDMDVLFRLYGNPLKHFRRLSDYTQQDTDAVNMIEKMRRYQYAQFNQLLSVLKKPWSNQLAQDDFGRFELENGAYVEWVKGDFVRIGLVQAKRGLREETIASPHCVDLAFSSGWFEYRIANMISHWHHAHDIMLNCIFPPKSKPSDTRFPKNEIDIIVNAGSKILFVECKTKINTSTDIDKFRNAVKNYGGTGSKALFITEEPMNFKEIEKCRESQIIYFSLKDQQYGPNKEQELFKLLNNELNIINT